MSEEEDDSPGVPEWVVTYGDMMSLLLTFFIMLVSLSEIVADKKYRAILDSIQKYQGYRSAPLAPPGDSFPLNSFVARLKTLGSPASNPRAHGGVQTKAIDSEDFHVFRLREGDTLRIGKPLSIAAGNPLSAETAAEIDGIARQLAGKPNKISVRALYHQGDQAGPEKGYARGSRVSERLIKQGLDARRIRIDLLPVAPSRQTGFVTVHSLDVLVEDTVGPSDGDRG